MIGYNKYKTQLEIFADDVKCSHGCTIGQLDEEALFYLRTRGIPINEARGLLTYAFANNVLDSVKIPKLKSRINQIISSKLEIKIDMSSKMFDVENIRSIFQYLIKSKWEKAVYFDNAATSKHPNKLLMLLVIII